MSLPPASPPVDVGALLDSGRSNRYQKSLVALIALTITFDGFDIQVLGLALPGIMAEWRLPRSAFAPIVSLGLLGMMVGAATAGLIGDRVGRRVALIGSITTFGLATTAIAFVDGLTALGALRLLAGLGLGGAIPNATALASECVPRAERALAVTLAIVCIPVGGTLAGLFAVPALPVLGWRGVFLVGGLAPLAMALVLLRWLPESPRYLVRHRDRSDELARLISRMGHPVAPGTGFVISETVTQAAPLATLFAREYRRDTLLLWVAFLSCLISIYLVFSWLPSLLTSAGLGAGVASTGLTAFNLGGVVGAIAGGVLITRGGSRWPMLGMAAGAVAGTAVLATMNISAAGSVTTILVMLTIAGGFMNALQTTMFALAAGVYPTRVRATGVGVASAVGRSGAILSGYAGPWALDLGGSTSFFGLMAVSLTVTLAVLAAIRAHIPPPR